jgi:hypothetical protein
LGVALGIFHTLNQWVKDIFAAIPPLEEKK